MPHSREFQPTPSERERLQSALRLLAHNVIRFGTFDQHMDLFETLVRLNRTLQPVLSVNTSTFEEKFNAREGRDDNVQS